MSIQAVAWALDQDLPRGPKLVLVSVANHANHTDGYCWLNADTIAREASCSRRAVFNYIGDLIRNGFVRKAPRRGDDGKQRANDYWILFHREPVAWIGDRPAEAEGADFPDEPDAELAGEEAGGPQDVDEPSARRALGEAVDKSVKNSAPSARRALGPSAPACTHIDSAEPSKTNPESARASARTPRHYQPPPPPQPPPVGTTVEKNSKWIFVFDGTEAYRAWQRVKSKETGRPWAAKTSKDGRWGWYFPSLFPPNERPPPADGALATADDLDHFARTG